ncbi:MAG: zf-TFIIB domain-containing protein [Gemmatimonadaceae bacterium]
MRSVRVGTTQMHECAGCSSTWLEAEAFTQLCTNREDRGAVTALVDVTKTPTQRTVTGTVRYVSCPTCHKTMNRQNFGKRSGVIIDVCKGHGVWFEHGELQSVLAFVDSGGLERARAADKERDAEEHRKLDRTAADAMMDRMRSGSGWASSPSESKSWLDDALRSLFS